MRGSEFFAGVDQAEATIAGRPAKLPVFYRDGSAMTAMFPARYGRLRALLPDPRFAPARLLPGLGAVVIGCLEYRDTDIGPYNELLIGVLLNRPSVLPNLPGRALVEAFRRRQFHLFVRHLPVTTEIALRGGVDFYNFPKVIAGIEFDQDDRRRRCRLTRDGRPILTLTGERLSTAAGGQVQYFLHLWMDQQPQRTEFRVNGLEVGATTRFGAAVLDLAEGDPIAQELGRLLVSRRSLFYEYAPSFEAILHGPEHLNLTLLRRLLAALAVAERRAA